MIHKEIIDHYSQDAYEDERLKIGIGRFEYLRTKEIVSRYLTTNAMKILDIGCATGAYSFWLAEMGHRVFMLDAVERHIEIAKAQIYEKNIGQISPKALEALCSRPWPGNVRELGNLMEGAVIFCNTTTIEPTDLFRESRTTEELPSPGETLWRLPFKEAKERVIREFHHQYVTLLLEAHGGNISKASETAGIQRQYLHQIMKESGLASHQFRNRSDRSS